jgi:hypothetical protein
VGLTVIGLVAALGGWPNDKAERTASASSTKEETMYVQVVTFNLSEMTEEAYLTVANDVFVPALTQVPGLMAKAWLRDTATNTYGGVYTWRDRQAMEDFAKSDLFRAFASDPHFVNITARTFDLIEGPTGATNGMPAPLLAR